MATLYYSYVMLGSPLCYFKHLQLRPEAMSSLLLELHTKRYTKDNLTRECNLARSRRTIDGAGADPGLYSPFGFKLRYGGLVPRG
jgi:hypothetical protein